VTVVQVRVKVNMSSGMLCTACTVQAHLEADDLVELKSIGRQTRVQAYCMQNAYLLALTTLTQQ